MNWNQLNSAETLQEIQNNISHEQPVLIFKHSTRCSVSSMALDRLERNWNEQEMQNVKPYFLDLIQHRDISNQIAEVFGIPHESPQVLLIKDGKVVYDNSHMGISYQEIKKSIEK
jgi:bacillithiol system protein YtxJ